jgi:hypothetical protein
MGRAALGLIATIVVAAWAAPGAAGAADCQPAGARTLVSNHRAVVYRKRHGRSRYGCSRDNGRRTQLDQPPYFVAYPAIALAGPVVAYAVEGASDPNEDDDTVIAVGNLTTGRAPKGFRQSPYASSRRLYDAKVGSIAVRRNGAVAWIACRTDQNVDVVWGNPRPSCVRPGAPDQVIKLDAGKHKPKILDRGHHIDPSSLRRTGGRLSWISGGKLRHARLR